MQVDVENKKPWSRTKVIRPDCINKFADAAVKKLNLEINLDVTNRYRINRQLVAQNNRDGREYLKLFQHQEDNVSQIVRTLVHKVLDANQDIKSYLKIDQKKFFAAVAVLYTHPNSSDQVSHQDNGVPAENEFLTILFNYGLKNNKDGVLCLGPSTAISEKNTDSKDGVPIPNPDTNPQFGAAFHGVQFHWGVGSEIGRASIMIVITTEPDKDENFSQENSTGYHKLGENVESEINSVEIFNLINPNQTQERDERQAKLEEKRAAAAQRQEERVKRKAERAAAANDEEQEKKLKPKYFVHI